MHRVGDHLCITFCPSYHVATLKPLSEMDSAPHDCFDATLGVDGMFDVSDFQANFDMNKATCRQTSTSIVYLMVLPCVLYLEDV